MYVQLTWHCSPCALAMLGPHPGSPQCTVGEGISLLQRRGPDRRSGSRTSAPRFYIRELPPLSGAPSLAGFWCLSVLWSQGGAGSPFKEGVFSLKKVPFVFGQLLHVAIVCAGHNASRDVVTLVKSILFHR